MHVASLRFDFEHLSSRNAYPLDVDSDTIDTRYNGQSFAADTQVDMKLTRSFALRVRGVVGGAAGYSLL